MYQGPIHMDIRILVVAEAMSYLPWFEFRSGVYIPSLRLRRERAQLLAEVGRGPHKDRPGLHPIGWVKAEDQEL